MYIGTSIVLIAVGAILRFAVDLTITGIDLQTVGLILIIVGVLALAVSLVVMISGGDDRRGRDPRDAPTRRY